MMGKIISIVVSILSLLLFGFFAGGSFVLNNKNKKDREIAEKKEKAQEQYQEKKQEILQEVFANAETKKAEISNSTDARTRFNSINDSLRNNKDSGKGGNT